MVFIEKINIALNKYQNYTPKNYNNCEKYIFGAGEAGKLAYAYLENEGINIKSFLDNDKLKQGTTLFDIPIIPLEKLVKKDAYIYIASTWCQDIENQLIEQGYTYEVLPIDILEWDKGDTYKLLSMDSTKKIEWLFCKFNDEESKDILSRMIEYRLTRDLSVIKKSSYSQYCHPSIDFDNMHKILDIGAFDGDTAIFFDQLIENGSIYSFEPVAKIYEKLQKVVLENNKFYPRNLGVWKADTMLQFDIINDEGGSNKASVMGEYEIKVKKIDTIVKEFNINIDFIKMDIEGAEVEALLGAENTIINNSPILAICVYHNALDLYRILKLLDSWDMNYEYYLGHHSQWMLETVLYAIPKK